MGAILGSSAVGELVLASLLSYPEIGHVDSELQLQATLACPAPHKSCVVIVLHGIRYRLCFSHVRLQKKKHHTEANKDVHDRTKDEVYAFGLHLYY